MKKWKKIMCPGMVPENLCFCYWGQTEVTSVRNTYKDIKGSMAHML